MRTCRVCRTAAATSIGSRRTRMRKNSEMRRKISEMRHKMTEPEMQRLTQDFGDATQDFGDSTQLQESRPDAGDLIQESKNDPVMGSTSSASSGL